jgi:pimeloyl-ACP methyl ester carboxylesterase
MRSLLRNIHFLYNSETSIQRAIQLIRDVKSANPNEPIVLMAYSWGGPAAFRVAEALGYAGPVGDQPTYNVDLMLLMDPEFFGRKQGSIFGPEQVPANVDRAVEYKAMFPTEGGLYRILPLPQDGEPEIRGALRVNLAGYIDIFPTESLKMTHQTIVNTRAGHEMMKRYLKGELSFFLGQ